MDGHLFNIQQHTFQRAYKFTTQEGVDGPVMFYKKHILKVAWKGRARNLELGIQLFIDPLEGQPNILAPTPLDDDLMSDILSLSALPAHFQPFWQYVLPFLYLYCLDLLLLIKSSGHRESGPHCLLHGRLISGIYSTLYPLSLLLKFLLLQKKLMKTEMFKWLTNFG